MNVGIVTRYQAQDTTYAALQVATLAHEQGHSVSVLATTPRQPGMIDRRWDGRVRRDRKFTDWAESRDVLVWMTCPAAEAVAWAQRPRGPARRGAHAMGRRTVLVAAWRDAEELVREVYPRFHHVVAPSHTAWDYLTADRKLTNVVAAPWSPGLPVTTHAAMPGPPRLHFPLCMAQSREHDADAIDVLAQLLSRRLPVRVTVTLGGRRGGGVTRRLERLARAHPNLALARCRDYEALMLALAEHDLTALLSVAETFGMDALCSMHAGTPVAGFAAPPLDEFIVNGKNGLAVPVATYGEAPGLTWPAACDRAAFVDALAAGLGDPARLAAIRINCTAGLVRRACAFAAQWRMLFGGRTG